MGSASDTKKQTAGSMAGGVQLSEQTKAILAAVDKPRDKVRTTPTFDAKRFKRFQAVFKKRETTASELLDSVIEDILAAYDAAK